MPLVEMVRDRRVRTAWKIWLRLLKTYFRVKVVGIENIPKSGSALIAPNHSGYAGIDAILLSHYVWRRTGRIPRVLAHRAFFDFSRRLKKVAEGVGMKKASIKNGVEVLKKNRLMIIFPEGEHGNFKPSVDRYRLRTFRTGFARIALEAGAPVVPCVIIGAEETHFNLGSIDLSKIVRGLKIPIPLNVVPLPAKWKILFLPPIDLGKLLPKKDTAYSEKDYEKIASKVQRQVQKAIIQELRARPYIYFRTTGKIVKKAKEIRKTQVGKLAARKIPLKKINRKLDVGIKRLARKAQKRAIRIKVKTRRS